MNACMRRPGLPSAAQSPGHSVRLLSIFGPFFLSFLTSPVHGQADAPRSRMTPTPGPVAPGESPHLRVMQLVVRELSRNVHLPRSSCGPVCRLLFLQVLHHDLYVGPQLLLRLRPFTQLPCVHPHSYSLRTRAPHVFAAWRFPTWGGGLASHPC